MTRAAATALDPRLVRLGIRVHAERAEEALARLLPVLAAGAEERVVEEAVEYAVYASAGELPADGRVRELAGDTLVGVVREPVSAGWERRWHEFLRPVRLGDLVVRPPWIDRATSDVVIDPGTCFGAGSHPTTRLCLRLLIDAPPARLVASGMLVDEVDEVVAAWGMGEVRRLEADGWAAVELTTP